MSTNADTTQRNLLAVGLELIVVPFSFRIFLKSQSDLGLVFALAIDLCGIRFGKLLCSPCRRMQSFCPLLAGLNDRLQSPRGSNWGRVRWHYANMGLLGTSSSLGLTTTTAAAVLLASCHISHCR